MLAYGNDCFKFYRLWNFGLRAKFQPNYVTWSLLDPRTNMNPSPAQNDAKKNHVETERNKITTNRKKQRKKTSAKNEVGILYCFMAIRCSNKTLHALFLKTMKNHVPFALISSLHPPTNTLAAHYAH